MLRAGAHPRTRVARESKTRRELSYAPLLLLSVHSHTVRESSKALSTSMVKKQRPMQRPSPRGDTNNRSQRGKARQLLLTHAPYFHLPAAAPHPFPFVGCSPRPFLFAGYMPHTFPLAGCMPHPFSSEELHAATPTERENARANPAPFE
jgi:hypothetical protein